MEIQGALAHSLTMNTRWLRHVCLDLDTVKMAQEHPNEEKPLSLRLVIKTLLLTQANIVPTIFISGYQAPMY